MAVKKAATAKKPVARKAPAKKVARKGQALECEVCGLAVTVDEDCGCVEECDIICCGQPMAEKKPRARAKVATKK